MAGVARSRADRGKRRRSGPMRAAVIERGCRMGRGLRVEGTLPGQEGRMHFSISALLVLVAFWVLLMLALSSGSAAVHVAEAVVTVLIAIGVGGFARKQRSTFPKPHRSMNA